MAFKYDERRYKSRKAAEPAPFDGGAPFGRRARKDNFFGDIFEGLLDGACDDIGGFFAILLFLLVAGLFLKFGISFDDFIDDPSLRRAIVPFITGGLLIWGAVAAKAHWVADHIHVR